MHIESQDQRGFISSDRDIEEKRIRKVRRIELKQLWLQGKVINQENGERKVKGG